MPLRILHTDDNLADLELLQLALGEIDPQANYVGVSDGHHCLKILKESLDMPKQFPQLLIIDLNMPEMNGFELLNQIRQEKMPHKFLMVILTSSMDPLDRAHGISLGADRFESKPKDFTDLLTLVAKLNTWAMAEFSHG